VRAFQAALAAIVHTPVPDEQPCRHLAAALQSAVHIGHDTDTVAAIAGAWLGARWGATAIPVQWALMLHGWPGYSARDLVRLGLLSVRHGATGSAGWPEADEMLSHYRSRWPAGPLCQPLAEDPGVLLANVYGALSARADVTVSLCRMGRRDLAGRRAIEVRRLSTRTDPMLTPTSTSCSRTLPKRSSLGGPRGKACWSTAFKPSAGLRRWRQRTWQSASGWGVPSPSSESAPSSPTTLPNGAFLAALRRLWPGPQAAANSVPEVHYGAEHRTLREPVPLSGTWPSSTSRRTQ
jgi:hypothetical protein